MGIGFNLERKSGGTVKETTRLRDPQAGVGEDAAAAPGVAGRRRH
jgi:hypothetical protein